METKSLILAMMYSFGVIIIMFCFVMGSISLLHFKDQMAGFIFLVAAVVLMLPTTYFYILYSDSRKKEGDKIT